MEELALAVEGALQSEDPMSFAGLLHPHVTWGAPGSARPPCTTRDQVVTWFGQGRESRSAAGITSRVTEVSVVGDDRILVGMMFGRKGAYQERWQLLGTRDGQIADIRGFEDRPSAVAYNPA